MTNITLLRLRWACFSMLNMSLMLRPFQLNNQISTFSFFFENTTYEIRTDPWSVYLIEGLVLEIWPVNEGDTTTINVTLTSGSDMTLFIDYGNGDLEEKFIQEHDDLTPFEVPYSAIGTYEVNVYLSNKRTYVSATAYAEVDQTLTLTDLTWNHVEFGSEVCFNVTASSGSRITIFVILGNGYALELYVQTYADLQPICYNYTTKGFNDVEIRISNSKNYTYRSILVAVVDRITELNITADQLAQNDTVPVNFTRVANLGSHVTCELSFGDGEMQVLYEEAISSTFAFTHVYPLPGIYSWDAMCTNYLDVFTFSGDVTVELPITGLVASTPSPKNLGGDITVTWTLATGTNLTFRINLTDTIASTTISIPSDKIFYEANALTGYALIADDLYTASDYTILVEASNLVSSAQVTVEVKVDAEITGAKLETFGNITHENVTETVCFNMSTLTGSRYTYSLDFGDESTPATGGSGQEPIGPIAFSNCYAYPNAGYYIVTLTVTNSINGEIVTTLLGAEKPIQGFTMSHNNVSHPSELVNITLHDAASSDPTHVMIFYDFKHDEETIEEEMFLDVSDSHTHNHYFPYYTYYTIEVRMWNNVSEQHLTDTVLVGILIEGLAVTYPAKVGTECHARTIPPDGSYYSLENATISIYISQGSNVNFTINFGDGTPEVLVERNDTDWPSPYTIIPEHSYAIPGTFTVTVTARNNVTLVDITATMECAITAQHPVPPFYITELPTQSLDPDVNVQFSLVKPSLEKSPTDAACNFTYDDGNVEEAVPMVMTGNTFSHQHVYDVPPGEKTGISIYCYNKISGITNTTRIMFHRAIKDLTVGIYDWTVEVDADATIWMNISWGSHINVSVDFEGNGEWNILREFHEDPTFYNATPLNKTFQYPEGNYTCRVNMYNDVSSRTVDCPRYFIVQYRSVPFVVTTNSPFKMVYPSCQGQIYINLDGNPQPPTDVFCSLNLPGSNNIPVIIFAGPLRQREQVNYVHTFPYSQIALNKRIDITCYNYISENFAQTTVDIIEELNNASLLIGKSGTGQCFFNVSQDVPFVMDLKYGSHLSLTLDFGDDSTIVSDSRDFSPWMGNFSHSYGLAGNYTPTVQLENSVSSKIADLQCKKMIIQNPIPPISITVIPGIVAFPPGEIKFEFTAVNTGDLATDVFIGVGELDAAAIYIGNELERPIGHERTYYITDRTFLGNNTLYANISNLVSSRVEPIFFQMQEKMAGLQVSPPNTWFKVGESVVVIANLTNGTHCQYRPDFDKDSAADVIQTLTVPEALDCAGNFSMSHIYSAEGTFTVNITAFNAISSISSDLVCYLAAEIQPLTLTVLNSVIASPPGIVNYSLCYNPIENTPIPGNVTVSILIGDGSPVEVKQTNKFRDAPDHCLNIGAQLLTSFKSGVLSTEINASNPVSQQNNSTRLSVFRMISEPGVTLVDTVVASGQSFNVTCEATEGSNLTIIADFGDGSEPSGVFLEELKENIRVDFSHVYNSSGRYSIMCSYINAVSSTNSTSMIDVERPIPPPNVTYPDVVSNPPGTFNWTIDFFPGFSESMNVSFTFDGVQVADSFLSTWPSQVEQGQAVYEAGDYNFTLTLSNRVSMQEQVLVVHFEEPIENLTLECLADNATSISTGELHVISLTKVSGTHMTVRAAFGDDNVEEQSWFGEDGMTSLNHTYTEDGDYTVEIEVSNLVGTSNASCLLSAYDPVLNLTFESDLQVANPNQTVQFFVRVPEGITPPSRAWIEFSTNVTNSSDVSEASPFLANGADFSRGFDVIGTVQVTVRVWNNYNELTLHTFVTVASLCRNLKNLTFNKIIRPNTTEMFTAIFNGPIVDLCLTYSFMPSNGESVIYFRGTEDQCARDPLFQPSRYGNISTDSTSYALPVTFPQVATLSLTLTLRTKCNVSQTLYTANITREKCATLSFINDFTNGSSPEWSMVYRKTDQKKLNQNILELSPDCQAPTMTCKVFKNTTTGPPEDTGNTLNLVTYEIANAETNFEYGDYFVLCDAQMELEPHKNATRAFFFKVEPRPITVALNENSGTISRGVTQEVTLSAEVDDPDGDTQNQLEYSWFCWREDEDQIFSTDQRIAVPTAARTIPGGCFDGQSGLLDVSAKTFTIAGDTLEASVNYVIKINVTKGFRWTGSQILIEVKVREQLNVNISVITGGLNERLNPQHNIKACAACGDCDSDITYDWSVTLGDMGASVNDLTDTATTEPVPGESNCIFLRADNIVPYKSYNFKCKITSNGANGEGNKFTCSADILQPGRFTIDPKTGIEFVTAFTFSATGWSYRSSEGCSPSPAKTDPGDLTTNFCYHQVNQPPDQCTEVLTPDGERLPAGEFEVKLTATTADGVIEETSDKVTVEKNEDIGNIQVDAAADPGAAINTAYAMGASIDTSGGSDPSDPSSGSSGSGTGTSLEEEERRRQVEQAMQQIVAALLQDPSPATIAALASSGVPLSDDQAKKMSSQLDSLPPKQKQETATRLLSVVAVEPSTEEPAPVQEEPDPDVAMTEDQEEAMAAAEQQRLEEQKAAAANVENSTGNIVSAIIVDLKEGETVVVGDENLQVTVSNQCGGGEIPTAGGEIQMPNRTSNSSSNSTECRTISIVFASENPFSFVPSAGDVTLGVFIISATEGNQPVDFEGDPMTVGISTGAEEKALPLDWTNATASSEDKLFLTYIPVEKTSSALVMAIDLGPYSEYDDLIMVVYMTFKKTRDSTDQPSTQKYDFNTTMSNHNGDDPGAAHTVRRKRSTRTPTQTETEWTLVIPEKYLGPPGLFLSTQYKSPVRKRPEKKLSRATPFSVFALKWALTKKNYRPRWGEKRCKKFRILKERKDPRELWPRISDFEARFRLPPSCVQQLTDEFELSRFRPGKGKDEKRGSPIPLFHKVCYALRYMAHGSYYGTIRDTQGGASRSSIGRAVESFCKFLCSRARKRIRFPKGQKLHESAVRFSRRHNMDQCVGCIDGTYVPIKRPIRHEYAYVCRKQYHALNVLIACDHEERITFVEPAMAGAHHDQGVLDYSDLGYQIAKNDRLGPYFLLGDGGYALTPQVMTPFRAQILDQLEPWDRRYQVAHTTARSSVERCIGQLKSRWRCLSKSGAGVIDMEPLQASRLVKACCVLHNMCLDWGLRKIRPGQNQDPEYEGQILVDAHEAFKKNQPRADQVNRADDEDDHIVQQDYGIRHAGYRRRKSYIHRNYGGPRPEVIRPSPHRPRGRIPTEGRTAGRPRVPKSGRVR